MKKFRINYQRTKTVFDMILVAYNERRYPFNLPEAKLPQREENMPKTLKFGSREHALFFFHACYYMRGGIKSDIALFNLSRVYDAYSFIFLPETFKNLNEDNLESYARSVREKLDRFDLGYNSKETARIWSLNAKKLYDFWDSNPLNLIKGVKNYNEACARIKNGGFSLENRNGFLGFREKMVSMLLYFYLDADLIDPFHFPIPIDFHVMRIMVSHELIYVEGEKGSKENLLSERFLKKIRETVIKYSKQEGINPINLCSALWTFSRILCSKQPGNRSEIGRYKARNTQVKEKVINWTSADVSLYEARCGLCLVSDTCLYNIPSANYYRRGELLIRSAREESPQGNLFKK